MRAEPVTIPKWWGAAYKGGMMHNMSKKYGVVVELSLEYIDQPQMNPQQAILVREIEI